MTILGLLVLTGAVGYVAGHLNGWHAGRLEGRAEVLRERSHR